MPKTNLKIINIHMYIILKIYQPAEAEWFSICRFRRKYGLSKKRPKTYFCLSEQIVFSPQPTNLPEGYCYPPFRPSVRTSVRPSVNIWDTIVCPRHFSMKPLSYGSETSHRVRIYIVDVQRRGFSLIDQKLSKLRGFELRRIWDILRYLFTTLSAALWYEAFVLEFSNFTQGKNIYCRCATLRFQFDRPKIVEITGVWT